MKILKQIIRESRKYKYMYDDNYNFLRVYFDTPKIGYVHILGFDFYNMVITKEQFERISVKWKDVNMGDWVVKDKVAKLDKYIGRVNKDDVLI